MLRRRKTELSKRGVWEPVEQEEDIVIRIVALLTYSGVEVYRIRERVPFTFCATCKRRIKVRGKFSEAGLPDLTGYIPPRTLERLRGTKPFVPYLPVPFYIEVKRPQGGVKRLAQLAFIERAQRDGVLAFFANSWEVVREEFGKLGIKLTAG